MSQENVEIVQAWLLAFEKDRDAFSAITHPAIEWMPFEENHTPTRGVEGALRIRDAWLDAWDEHTTEIEEILGRDDGVYLAAKLIGRGRGSGATVEVRLYGHIKVRDGKVVYVYEHLNREDALKAVGLED
jgi:ketosteroid isomerase-like protein